MADATTLDPDLVARAEEELAGMLADGVLPPDGIAAWKRWQDAPPRRDGAGRVVLPPMAAEVFRAALRRLLARAEAADADGVAEAGRIRAALA